MGISIEIFQPFTECFLARVSAETSRVSTVWRAESLLGLPGVWPRLQRPVLVRARIRAEGSVSPAHSPPSASLTRLCVCVWSCESLQRWTQTYRPVPCWGHSSAWMHHEGTVKAVSHSHAWRDVLFAGDLWKNSDCRTPRQRANAVRSLSGITEPRGGCAAGPGSWGGDRGVTCALVLWISDLLPPCGL